MIDSVHVSAAEVPGASRKIVGAAQTRSGLCPDCALAANIIDTGRPEDVDDEDDDAAPVHVSSVREELAAALGALSRGPSSDAQVSDADYFAAVDSAIKNATLKIDSKKRRNVAQAVHALLSQGRAAGKGCASFWPELDWLIWLITQVIVDAKALQSVHDHDHSKPSSKEVIATTSVAVGSDGRAYISLVCQQGAYV